MPAVWVVLALLALAVAGGGPQAVQAVQVVAPSVVKAGKPCAVAVLDADPGTIYMASLESSSNGVVLESAAEEASGAVLQLDMLVPVDVEEGTYTLSLRSTTKSTGVPTIPVISKEVAVQGQKKWLMLETDKPIYKPGSTVKARCICLVDTLEPCEEQLPVRLVLKNPDGIKVYASLATTTTSYAIVEGDLLIDSLAPLGTYTVVAEGPTVELSTQMEISVDEYVLPKFEVEISTVEEFVVQGGTSISGTISAKYSYGQDVEGTATLLAKAPGCFYPLGMRWAPWGFGGPTEDFCQGRVLGNLTGIEVNGSHNFELSWASDKLNFQATTVELEVVFTETATGEQMNATTSVDVIQKEESKLTISGPEEFSPGLPILYIIKSHLPDGTPDDGDFNFTIAFKPYGWKLDEDMEVHIQETVTIEGGVAKLEIVAPPTRQCCLNAISSYEKKLKSGASGNPELWHGSNCCWAAATPTIRKIKTPASSEEPVTYMDGNLVYGTCMNPAYPPGKSYLQVSAENASDGSVDISIASTDDLSLTSVVFMVTAQDVLLQSGMVPSSEFVYADKIGRATFQVQLSKDMIPSAHVVVAYTSDEGNLVAADAAFEVSDLALLGVTPVTLSIDSTVENDVRGYVTPGEEVLVSTSASPGSLLFLGAVDRSVSYLSNQDTRVTTSRLLKLLKAHFGAETEDNNNDGWPKSTDCGPVGAFASAGVSVDLTQLSPLMKKLCYLDEEGLPLKDASMYSAAPPHCISIDFLSMRAMPAAAPFEMNFAMAANNAGPAMMMEKAEIGGSYNTKNGGGSQVRTSFPETWIWRSVTMAGDGSYSFHSAVPDTITSWDMSGFSVGSDGLGVVPVDSPTASMTVFKPLFVQLTLPYKVVRNEILEVVATVFNFMPEEHQVELILAGVTGVNVPVGNDMSYLSVPANSAASVSVNLTFDSIGTATLRLEGRAEAEGNTDAVLRSIKVVPEGYAQQSTVNVLLDLKGDSQASELSTVPGVEGADLVPGSAYSRLTLTGDLMGPTLEGLDGLVKLPMGCGEQNMLLMAPNVYIIAYMDAVQTVEPSLRAKALEYIQVGYFRELQYRHSDGSFSAFGEQDDSGSTWLTAFVLKVFSQAHSAGHIEVDAEIAQQMVEWLMLAQNKGGSFQSLGRVIHSDMMGGVDDDEGSPGVSLTAFIVNALLEANTAKLLQPEHEKVIQLGLSFVISSIQNATAMSSYAKVVSAHAIALANQQGLGEEFGATVSLEILEALQLLDGDLVYWAPSSAIAGDEIPSDPDSPVEQLAEIILPPCGNCHKADASGPAVEMTGYALHAKLAAGQDLAEVFPAVRWLLAERSPTGGWKSTQDTVVALEGLTAYAAQAVADPPIMTVDVSAPGMLPKQLSLTLGNADVVQHIDVPTGATVLAYASGKGTAILSMTNVWHTVTDLQSTDLTMEASSVWSEGAISLRAILSRQSGPSESGMMVADLGLFTGWQPTPDSLEALLGSCNGAVKRQEVPGDGRVVVYIDQLSIDAPCELRVDLAKDTVVGNLQPVPAEVYFYYQPDARVSTLVKPPSPAEDTR